ncbi:MAG: hypothetical protein ABW022_05435 [Actinoplanes sp.]
MPAQDWRATGERIDALLAAHAPAEEVAGLVADLYGAGLERLLEIAYEHGALDGDLIDALADDDLVASLLLVHGLHPYDVDTRLSSALASVPHGEEITVLGLADGVLRLRLPAAHHGCQFSPDTVTEAIEAAVPEVTAFEFVETAPVIPVSALFTRIPATGR